MSAPVVGQFQDHYEVLGIDHRADSTAIADAYHRLAARFHPRTAITGNPDKFKAVTAAFEVLSDPALRRAFDDLRPNKNQKEGPPKFGGASFFESLGNDVGRRLCVLCLLYDRRREKPATGGLSMRYLEAMIKATPEELQLTVWYLKQRNLVEADDKSNMLITVEGMDYLTKNLPTADSIYALLKATSPEPEEPAK